MSDVINLSNYRKMRFLGSLEFYRHPNGEIVARIVDMDVGEIEKHETVPERFTQFQEWCAEAIPSLGQQAADFAEDQPNV